MRILAIGDVCGSGGCNKLLKHLPQLKREYGVDFTVVNGENSDDANCISPTSADLLFKAGADVITGGNHTLRRKDFHPYLDSQPGLLRPHNIPADYGGGYCLVDKGYCQVAVINLMGQIYLENQKASNPFLCADELVDRAKADGASIILVDFHAEATSEKRALGYHLDGRVSAVFGTHTHVQTADVQLLPCGTAYITDLGMTGPACSILGVDKDIIIDRLKNGGTAKFVFADGDSQIQGMLFDADPKTGLATDPRLVCIK
ncbi:MAG: TIGR00282 family metallophosphoesterase [Clostridia bacterium]|nr:TIGR00282 family metallophosphoesterase [Clostridia bacterium]